MSCYIAPLAGGTPEIFPMPHSRLQELMQAGETAMVAALGRNLAEQAVRYVGAARKPDGTPFYLTTIAPGGDHNPAEGWTGAFFAPFGFGAVSGTVRAAPEAEQVMRVIVGAKLIVQGKEHAAAEWTIYGSQHTTANKAVIIESVAITNPGPHAPEDMRRCIALHAPRVLGEPRAIVALQCGVAVACLVEAIC